LLPVQLQVVSGYSPLASGLALLPLTLIMLALSARSGRLATRIGPRLQMSAGPVIAGAGPALLVFSNYASSYVVYVLDEMGVQAFAERARRELLATGETARKRTVETTVELTAQEAQIARLARDGLSNPEIGARLFISARTVQYHLSKVFTKLAISSRSQLGRALPGDRATA
jgi:DNA-binding CsgD family transcriptional regulator